MERDACVSFGASALLRERLMLASDGYQTVYCRNCGTMAVSKPNMTYEPCAMCGRDNDFGTVTIPYAYKLLVNLLAAMGINLRPKLETSEQHIKKILRNEGIDSSGEAIDIKQELDEADEGLDEEQAEEDEIAERDEMDINAFDE